MTYPLNLQFQIDYEPSDFDDLYEDCSDETSEYRDEVQAENEGDWYYSETDL